MHGLGLLGLIITLGIAAMLVKKQNSALSQNRAKQLQQLEQEQNMTEDVTTPVVDPKKHREIMKKRVEMQMEQRMNNIDDAVGQ